MFLVKLKSYYSALLNKFHRSLFIQNVALISSGSIISRFIGLFTAPLITRIYSPEQYGILSIFTAIIGVAGSFSTLRYSVTIPLAKDEETSDHLLRLSFIVTSILSIIITFIIIFFGNSITNKFDLQSIQQYLWVIPISFFGVGIYEALSFWATRHKHFKLITRTILIQSIYSRAIKIGFGLVEIKPLGLLLGFISSQASGSGNLLKKLLTDKPDFFKKTSWNKIIEVALRYKRFPFFQSLSQLLLSFGANLPTLFLANIFDTKVAGLYGLANGMVGLPMNIFGNAISQVYYAEIAKFGKSNIDKIYKLTVSVVKKLFLAAFLPATILIVFGPFLFSIIFGKNWYDAGIYARILSIVILFRFISTPVMHCLNVLEKQGYQLYLNIARFLLVLVTFFIAGKLNRGPIFCITAYSISISLFYAVTILLILKMLKNQIPQDK